MIPIWAFFAAGWPDKILLPNSGSSERSTMIRAIILFPAGEIHSPVFISLAECLIIRGYHLEIFCHSFSSGIPIPQNQNVTFHSSDITDPHNTAILFKPDVQLDETTISETEKRFGGSRLVIGIDFGIIEACILARILKIPFGLLALTPSFLLPDSQDLKETLTLACHGLDFALCQNREQASSIASAYHVPYEKLLDPEFQLLYDKTVPPSPDQTLSDMVEEQIPLEELEYLVTLINQGKLEEAESIAQSQTMRFPSDGVSWKLHGAVLKMQGRLEESLFSMQKASALLPTDASAHNNLGVCFNDQGYPEESEASLRRALAIEPSYIHAHNNLGITLKGLGRLQEAKSCYLYALQLDPDCAEAYCNLGAVLNELGQPKEAEASYQHAIAIRPDYCDALNNYSLFLNQQGRAAEALHTVLRSLHAKETGAAKNIFAGCLKNPPIIHPSDNELYSCIIRALAEPWGTPGELMQPCTAILKQNRAFYEIVMRAVAAWPLQDQTTGLFTNSDFAAISENKLLCTLLNTAPICDLELERFLTLARKTFLKHAAHEATQNIENCSIFKFHAALANQCFINEYVFACSETELNTANELKSSIIAALNNNTEIPLCTLLAVATYFPLYSLPEPARLNSMQWPVDINDVIRFQVVEPLIELRERGTLPCLTPIDNEISLLVQDQYENNPYPRWIKAAPPGTITTVAGYLHQIFPNADFRNPLIKNVTEILIAGCGTGQHPIGTAQRFRNASILAIDLSLCSLSYAKRKSRELGITSVEYAQADILKLSSLGRMFDSIESSGVLHHTANPWNAWSILLSLLRPGGFMKLGFYSAIARRKISQLRTLIAERKCAATVDDIRQYRQELLGNARYHYFTPVLQSCDFFSVSSCRDLLFHVQEHCLSLPDIDTFINLNNLVFLGFEIDEKTLAAYKKRFPADTSATDLAQWDIFEHENPDIFFGMYQFWIQKPV